MHLFHRPLFAALIALAILLPGAAVLDTRSHAQAWGFALRMASSQRLVTAQGFSIYIFAADRPNLSVCYSTCAAFWPPLLVPSGIQLAMTVPGVAGRFGMIVRTDGSHQLTFDGAPLYTFIYDKLPGELNGQGLFASGGYWWAVVVPVGRSYGYGG